MGWAYNPRLVKSAEVIDITVDNGTSFSCTPDHKVLLRTAEWIEAGNLKQKDELMPFYRLSNSIGKNINKGSKVKEENLKNLKRNQFARIFTMIDGWKSERQFIDEWKIGEKSAKQEKYPK